LKEDLIFSAFVCTRVLFRGVFVGCVVLFPNGQEKGETLHGRDLAWFGSSSIALDFVKRVARDCVTG